MQSDRDLIAWQKAMDLVQRVYGVTSSWPKEELYGLSSQVRRAVVSIPANIAEGQGRQGNRELLHHLSIVSGSLHEAETHLLIAARLRYLDETTCQTLIVQAAGVGRLIYGLMRSIRNSSPESRSPTQERRRLSTDDRRPTTDD